jgi:putative FmdB family regulatory protein
MLPACSRDGTHVARPRNRNAQRRELDMPTYEYECKKCGHGFSLVMSIEQLDKTKVQCPKCKSQDVVQLMEPVFVRASRKA